MDLARLRHFLWQHISNQRFAGNQLSVEFVDVLKSGHAAAKLDRLHWTEKLAARFSTRNPLTLSCISVKPHARRTGCVIWFRLLLEKQRWNHALALARGHIPGLD